MEEKSINWKKRENKKGEKRPKSFIRDTGSNVHASNFKKASKYINQSDDEEQMTSLSA